MKGAFENSGSIHGVIKIIFDLAGKIYELADLRYGHDDIIYELADLIHELADIERKPSDIISGLADLISGHAGIEHGLADTLGKIAGQRNGQARIKPGHLRKKMNPKFGQRTVSGASRRNEAAEASNFERKARCTCANSLILELARRVGMR